MSLNADGTRKSQPPLFFLFDDDANEVSDSLLLLPKRPTSKISTNHKVPKSLPKTSRRAASPYATHADLPLLTPTTSNASSIISPSTGRDPQFKNLEDILKFPIESSHAYSYAHLSPNSLALRLNVLKRSLEILKDRPNLKKSINLHNTDKPETESKRRSSLYSLNSNYSNSSLDRGLQQPPPLLQLYKHSNNSGDFNDSNKSLKLQTNASSAALSALFRPQFQRSDSFPVNQMYSTSLGPEAIHEKPSSKMKKVWRKSSAPSGVLETDSLLNNDLKEIITLLESDPDLMSKNSEIASTLHNISLSTHDLPLDGDNQQLKYTLIKNKLLYALATPFVENSVMTSSLLQDDGSNTPNKPLTPVHPSTAALNMLNSTYSPSNLNLASLNTNNNYNNNNRPFHGISSGKRALPQSVFTVELDNPWSVKAANDLACLMFGVLKNMIKSLTLMDLIAPQFRNFVTERLTNYISRNLDLSMRLKRNKPDENKKVTNNNILFAGEIVAILRPGDQNYAWTSMWAKRKGNLIICMFDQIPCDAFDVVILCTKENANSTSGTSINSNSKSKTSLNSSSPLSPYQVDSFNEIAGSLISQQDNSKFTKLNEISESLDFQLRRVGVLDESNDHEEEIDSEEEDGALMDYDVSKDVTDSQKINRTRYYTLQMDEDENIPCAITSNPLEINADRYEIKLKIHSLPYIAGIFVVNSSTYDILSCNNAIAKNLFGRSSDEINDGSINALIPNFTKILKLGMKHILDSFDLCPGLVLPEHFFRRYDAILRNKAANGSESDEEDLFFSSAGIEGIHRDGKSIFVDVQVRASQNDTLVVWITYSRLTNKTNMSEELDKLSSSASSISLNSELSQLLKVHKEPLDTIELLPPKKTFASKTKTEHKRTSTNIPKNSSSAAWPSQLKLFPSEDDTSVEYAPSSAEINRQNSTRKARHDTFGIPVSYLNNKFEKPTALTKIAKDDNTKPESKRIVSNTSSIPTDSPSTAGSTSTAPTTTSKTESEAFTTYKKYTEEEILKIESEALQEKIAESTNWPSSVGTKRRTKKFAEFKVLKDMGEGAYGKVVLAEHREDPIYKIIIKCIDKERILVDTWVRDRNLGTIPSEIQIMAFLNNEPHPNIMRIIDFFEDLKYYYLETPIFGDPPGIDLFDYIEVKKDMTELECQFIFKQIVSSIYHLHNHGIVHRDIKDENIIVDENGIIKLIDFGSAGYTKQGPFDVFVGTIDYASPEVLGGEKYEGKPQDIWALGILLYTMLYKENPFYNVDEIMEGDLRIPYVVSEGSMKLIKKILVREVDQRPTITDIVEDDWLII